MPKYLGQMSETEALEALDRAVGRKTTVTLSDDGKRYLFVDNTTGIMHGLRVDSVRLCTPAEARQIAAILFASRR